MTTDTVINTNLPIPPGEYLEEVLENLGMSKGELAKRMSRPQSKLSGIFNGRKAVTPNTALQLQRATGVPAHIWTGLEAEYRLAQARERAEEREVTCRQEAHLVTRFCYRELVKLQLAPEHTRPVDKVKALQAFFGVMSLNSVLELPRYRVAFRHGGKALSDRSPEAVAAWLRVGEVTAQKAECAPFDKGTLEAILGDIRTMTVGQAAAFSEPLRRQLATAGVALVCCPHFARTRAHGATFFLNPDKAVLMITLRYNWADIFWFTLFHEVGHLLLHGSKSVILEDSGKNRQEDEADGFARDALVPPEDWDGFVDTEPFSRTRIKRFARESGVAPGIVVGRLQHEKRIGQAEENELRTRYEFR